jgi:ElaB/YqjD/DUF883 family membrane-anchored ribosome-binding protein
MKSDDGAARAGDQLSNDVAALRKDFAVLAEHMKALAGASASDAKHGLAERGARLREATQEAAEAAKQRGQAGVAAVEHQVQMHPLAAVAIAFGAGMVVSRLLSRDR